MRIEIDIGRQWVGQDGAEVALTPKERRLVMELAKETPNAVKYKVLEDAIECDDGPLKVHVSRLRQKLGVEVVQTIRQYGLRLHPDVVVIETAPA